VITVREFVISCMEQPPSPRLLSGKRADSTTLWKWVGRSAYPVQAIEIVAAKKLLALDQYAEGRGDEEVRIKAVVRDVESSVR
jgi:hypothetical protein